MRRLLLISLLYGFVACPTYPMDDYKDTFDYKGVGYGCIIPGVSFATGKLAELYYSPLSGALLAFTGSLINSGFSIKQLVDAYTSDEQEDDKATIAKSWGQFVSSTVFSGIASLWLYKALKK